MSRIEEALEKAARLRSNQSAPVYAPNRECTPVQGPPSAPVDAIKISNPLLVAVSDPHTPVAEEYRKLRSIVIKLTNSDSFRNMLMVTSSISNEGKSITSLNLALTLAQDYDHSVLLIDADLRKPSLHSYLGLEPRVGLSECLLEGTDIKNSLVKTGIGNLSLLPAGKEVRNPSEVYSSQYVRKFFLEIKHRYPDRYIIIDTPPVLPFAETRCLSAVVDGVILVVKEGAVPLHQISETMDCLNGVSILGVVYNEATLENQSDHYYYYRRGYAGAY